MLPRVYPRLLEAMGTAPRLGRRGRVGGRRRRDDGLRRDVGGARRSRASASRVPRACCAWAVARGCRDEYGGWGAPPGSPTWPPTRTSRARRRRVSPACAARSPSPCAARAASSARSSCSPARPIAPDRALLRTMASLGRQIGQAIERARAEVALRDSIARKSAILDAALRLRHHDGRRGPRCRGQTARRSAPSATAPRTWSAATSAEPDHPARNAGTAPPRRAPLPRDGAGRADARPPPRAHRPARRRQPVSRSRSRSPSPSSTGRRCSPGFLRDVTDRPPAPTPSCARSSPSRPRCGGSRRSSRARSMPATCFSAVTEEVGRLLGAHSANMVRYEAGGEAAVVGRLERGRRARGRGGRPCAARRRHGGGARVADRVRQPRRRLRRHDGRARRLPALDRYPLRGRRPDHARRAAVGRGHRLVGEAERVPGPATRSGSRASRSSPGRRSPTRRRASSSPPRAPGSSKPATPSAGASSANLHDGAQQRLVALALTVRLAERKLETDPGEACVLLGRAGTELEQALRELRELARGLHPAVAERARPAPGTRRAGDARARAGRGRGCPSPSAWSPASRRRRTTSSRRRSRTSRSTRGPRPRGSRSTATTAGSS